MTFRIVGSSLMTPMAWTDLPRPISSAPPPLTLGSKADPFFLEEEKLKPRFHRSERFLPTGTAREFYLRNELRGGVKPSERFLKRPGDYINSCLKLLSVTITSTSSCTRLTISTPPGSSCMNRLMAQITRSAPER